MAYICHKKIKCKDCSHYRYNDTTNKCACFVEQDMKGITVRPLTESDEKSISELDELSGNDVVAMIDAKNYAYGIFKDNKLIGYCTFGGADIGDLLFETHPNYTNNSKLLSDVYIHPDYRRHGYCEKLLNTVLNTDNHTVFLTLLDEDLMPLYEQFGFKLYDRSTLAMVKKGK